MTPTLLAVDGNSVLHRCFHASARTGFHTADGRPAWAIRGFLAMLGAAVDRSCADAVVVGFDDPAASVRRERWPIYKAQRVPKPSTLDDQLRTVVPALEELGVVVVRPQGLEADDVLASAAAWAPSVGARTVIATSDRDSFALIDDNTKMLRILNGGVDASPMLDPHRLTLVAGVRPDQYLDYAALRGDPSDNLPGVRGFGPKTAARLLAEFDDAESAFEEAAGGGERCRAALGKALAATLRTPEARTAFALNKAVMTMHHDLPARARHRGRGGPAAAGPRPGAGGLHPLRPAHPCGRAGAHRHRGPDAAPAGRRQRVLAAPARGFGRPLRALPKVPEPDPTLF